MLDAQPVMMSVYPLPTWRHLGDISEICVLENPRPVFQAGNLLPPAVESEDVL